MTSGEQRPIWYDVTIPTHFPSLGNQNISVDVCVVGGGLGGLTSAYLLAREGKRVALLEARQIASGETGRTTAHLMSALDDRLYNIARMHGRRGAEVAVSSHQAAIDLIEQIVAYENISCDFERVPGYLFSSPGQQKKADKIIDNEMEALKEIGFQGTHIVDRAPIPGGESGRAIMFPNQGQFHPLKYVLGLLQALQRLGVLIYTNTHVQDASGGGDTKVTTVDGGTVQCSDVVIATCIPMNSRVLMVLKQEAFRTYVIAGRVPRGSVTRALFWDTEDPYHYVRLSGCDATSDYLIVGGEDHAVGHPADKHDQYLPFRTLEAWTRTHWPMMGPVEYTWSGEVYEPIDLVGLMGRSPAHDKNIYVISGDSGTGMTHTTIGAKIITDMIMGRHNEWEALYHPGRRPSLRAAKSFARYAGAEVSGYSHWLRRSDYPDIEDIEPGCGGVIRCGLHHVAVYKDPSGQVHRQSAVCPHLGGLVVWNDVEKSWDCPVHGSRFDKTGALLNGPAFRGLAKDTDS